MVFARSIFAACFIGGLLAAPAGALPVARDTPAPAPSATAADHPHDGGIIAGKISSVDYVHNAMIVNKTDIALLPSTQIQGSDASYRVITDLKRGMSVEVYTSQVDGKYIAQIITVR